MTVYFIHDSKSTFRIVQGNNVHFAPGQYSPESGSGQKLLGHELAHVVQQRQGRVRPDSEQKKGMNIKSDTSLEKEADVIVWDGGNNDTPFYFPDVHIVIFDPHRAGHETLYYPGETNMLMADIAVINKVDNAKTDQVNLVRQNIEKHLACRISKCGHHRTIINASNQRHIKPR